LIFKRQSERNPGAAGAATTGVSAGTTTVEAVPSRQASKHFMTSDPSLGKQVGNRRISEKNPIDQLAPQTDAHQAR
jgi:hypothetical protein